MAMHVADKRLLAGVDELDRPVRVEGEQRAVDLHREILPAAERASDAGQVDAHLLRPQVETGRDLRAVDVQPLRRHVDVDAALAVRDREPGFRPEEGLILDAQLVLAADRDVSRRVGIAVTDQDRADDVRARVVAVVVGLVRRPVGMELLLLEGALHVDDRLERLVRDADPLGRAPGLFRVLGGHERDGLAVVADAVDREHRLVGVLEPVDLRARDVGVREDGVDAGHRDRLGDVDLADERVRVRAPHGVSPEHPRRLEVARVRELAGRLRDPVGARHHVAHTPDLELPRGRAHAVSAASRIASKIFA